MNDATNTEFQEGSGVDKLLIVMRKKAEEKGKSLEDFSRTEQDGKKTVYGTGFTVNTGSEYVPVQTNLWVDVPEEGFRSRGLFWHRHTNGASNDKVEGIDPDGFLNYFNKWLDEKPLYEPRDGEKDLNRLEELLKQ